MNTNVNKNNSRLTLSLTFKGFIISSFFDDDGYTNIYIYIYIYIYIVFVRKNFKTDINK